MATGDGAKFQNNAQATLRLIGTYAPIEIVTITGIAGDVLTMTRNSETAQGPLSVSTLYEIFQAPTVKTFTDIESGDFSTAAGPFKVRSAAANVVTAAAAIEYDTTQVGLSAGGAGTIGGYLLRHLSSQQPAGDSLTAAGTNTVETAFATSFSIPASMLIAGKRLFFGALFNSTATATIPTSQLRLRVQKSGPVNVNLIQTTAAALASGSKQIFIHGWLVGTAAAGAAVNVVAGWIVAFTATFANGINTISQPVAIATNAAQSLQITIQWGTNAASNSMQLVDFWVAEAP